MRPAVFAALVVIVSSEFEDMVHSNSSDWWTQRIEAEQNGCQAVRDAYVWSEFHLAIPAESEQLFESWIPALRKSLVDIVNTKCGNRVASPRRTHYVGGDHYGNETVVRPQGDPSDDCPTLTTADVCVLPEPPSPAPQVQIYAHMPASHETCPRPGEPPPPSCYTETAEDEPYRDLGASCIIHHFDGTPDTNVSDQITVSGVDAVNTSDRGDLHYVKYSCDPIVHDREDIAEPAQSLLRQVYVGLPTPAPTPQPTPAPTPEPTPAPYVKLYANMPNGGRCPHLGELAPDFCTQDVAENMPYNELGATCLIHHAGMRRHVDVDVSAQVVISGDVVDTTTSRKTYYVKYSCEPIGAEVSAADGVLPLGDGDDAEDTLVRKVVVRPGVVELYANMRNGNLCPRPGQPKPEFCLTDATADLQYDDRGATCRIRYPGTSIPETDVSGQVIVSGDTVDTSEEHKGKSYYVKYSCANENSDDTLVRKVTVGAPKTMDDIAEAEENTIEVNWNKEKLSDEKLSQTLTKKEVEQVEDLLDTPAPAPQSAMAKEVGDLLGLDGRRLLELSMASQGKTRCVGVRCKNAIKAIFVIGTKTVREATALKNYIKGRRVMLLAADMKTYFYSDLLAAMISNGVLQNDNQTFRVYNEGLIRNVNKQKTCHSSCDHKCEQKWPVGSSWRPQPNAPCDPRSMGVIRHRSMVPFAKTPIGQKPGPVGAFRCFVNEQDKCQCNCHPYEHHDKAKRKAALDLDTGSIAEVEEKEAKEEKQGKKCVPKWANSSSCSVPCGPGKQRQTDGCTGEREVDCNLSPCEFFKASQMVVWKKDSKDARLHPNHFCYTEPFIEHHGMTVAVSPVDGLGDKDCMNFCRVQSEKFCTEDDKQCDPRYSSDSYYKTPDRLPPLNESMELRAVQLWHPPRVDQMVKLQANQEFLYQADFCCQKDQGKCRLFRDAFYMERQSVGIKMGHSKNGGSHRTQKHFKSYYGFQEKAWNDYVHNHETGAGVKALSFAVNKIAFRNVEEMINDVTDNPSVQSSIDDMEQKIEKNWQKETDSIEEEQEETATPVPTPHSPAKKILWQEEQRSMQQEQAQLESLSEQISAPKPTQDEHEDWWKEDLAP